MNSFDPLPSLSPAPPTPLILVADDDLRVLELLKLALTQQNFRVVTATDGDEAIRRALAERPDLAVLDVRMPRKSGLEVCDYLRHDPDDPHVPVILVSASTDTESRLEGLARGADDVLGKPFSPKELVARIRRLLARSGEARGQRRRVVELERELSRAREESRRTHGEMQHERRMREMAFGYGRELHRILDMDELAASVLAAVQRHLGPAVLLAPGFAAAESGARLAPIRVRGEGPARFAALALDPEGELAVLLAGLARPVRIHELRRFSELRAELLPLEAAGVAVLLPLRVASGLEAVIAAGERHDGAVLAAGDIEALGALAEMAATAWQNARRYRALQDRSLELLAGRSPGRESVRDETGALALEAARELRIPECDRSLLAHAVRLGAWGWSSECQAALLDLERHDGTSRVARLRELIAAGQALEWPADAPRALQQAALLAGVCVRHAVSRGAGRSSFESWATAMSWAGAEADGDAREALRRAFEVLNRPPLPSAEQVA